MPTTLPPPGAPDVLYLVDLSSYVFRAYHAVAPLSSPSGEPTHATYGTVSMLQKLVSDRQPALLAVAMDSKKRTFRHDIDPNYKATRPPPPEDLSLQMERCRQIVEAFGIPVFQRDGVEADDLIAAVVAQAQTAGLFVVIVGADKDLMQLATDRVVLWDTMRDRVFGPEEVQEKMGVPPRLVRDLLALVGDSSDNVPGVPSVGQKTAADLVSKFGTLDSIYARIDEIPRERLREALRQHEADARLSLDLVTLRADQPIEWSPEKLAYGGADFERLRALYTELGFSRLAAAIPAGTKPAKAAPAFLTIADVESLRAVVADARRAGAVAIRVETTSPEPMRASLIGLALCSREASACYVPIAHRYLGAPKQIALGAVREVLAPLFADRSIKKVGHDVKYADVVLGQNGMTLGGAAFDVMLASYLLNPDDDHDLAMVAKRELGAELPAMDQIAPRTKAGRPGLDEVDIEKASAYAAANVEAAWRLSERMPPAIERDGLGRLLADVEMPLCRVLAGMERAGVLVDLEELSRLRKRVDAEIAELEKDAKKAAGRDFNLSSPRQLEVILFDELGFKPGKKTKTGRSTDADVLAALTEDTHNPLPGLLLDHRRLSKLKGTYIDALPALVNPGTGRIHTEWSQAVAATGRISSNNPNLQNIPIRTDLGREIRRAFVAPKGMRIVSADYSQIELRILAHLSKDPVLLDAFRTGQDVHARTAMEVFGVKADLVTDEMRRRAKTINFGVIYGMGPGALSKSLKIGRAEAAAFIDAYFERYRGVRTFMDETLASAKKDGSVRTLFGRRRMFPDLAGGNAMLRAAAEREAKNSPIQGTAADLLKLAMLKLADPPVPGARMVLTVHDELVFEVPEGSVSEAMSRVKQAMQDVFPLDVPLDVDVGSGPSWGQLE